MLPAPRSSTRQGWLQKTHIARAESQRRRKHTASFHALRDVEKSQRLRDGHEKCVVGDVATQISALAIAELPGPRIGFGGACGSLKEVFWAEMHGFSVRRWACVK